MSPFFRCEAPHGKTQRRKPDSRSRKPRALAPRCWGRSRYASGKESASASVTAANRIGIGPRIGGPLPRNRERTSWTKRQVSNPQIGPALAMLLAGKEGMTSNSSQGLTAERVLIHVDTELVAKDLLNNRMAYVAVSRGAVRCTAVHQRPREAGCGARVRCFPPQRACARGEAGPGHCAAAVDRATAGAGAGLGN